MGILLNRLLILLNDSKPESIEYHIAFTMINHFYELYSMTISDVANLCNVSKAKISKFVRELHFEDYSEFRSASIFKENKYGFHLNYNNNIAKTVEKLGFEYYLSALQKDIYLCKDNLDESKIQELVKEIKKSSVVASFGLLFSEIGALDLQMKLAYNGKFILTNLDDIKQDDFIKRADENTLIIIYSNSGKYMENQQLSELQVKKNFLDIKAKIALITSNEKMSSHTDVDICICFKHATEIQTHGVIYQVINDKIVMEYRKLS